MEQRLDKCLSSQGTLSRKEAGTCIRAGRVTVDSVICRRPEQKIDPERQRVALDGEPLCYREHLYLMLHKPSGIVCVSRDPRAKTVVDLVPPAWRRSGLFPAGRLDKDTTGLVLLTDDGDLAHRMLSPKKEIFKQYAVTVDGPLGDQEAAAFREGIRLEDGTLCRPARLMVVRGETPAQALVEICEGRFHQIKRMFRAVGRTVTALERRKIGELSLDPALSSGACRELTEAEKQAIFL